MTDNGKRTTPAAHIAVRQRAEYLTRYRFEARFTLIQLGVI